MSERHAQAMEAMPHSLPMMGISELWICRTGRMGSLLARGCEEIVLLIILCVEKFQHLDCR